MCEKGYWFISYSSKDSSVVAALVDILKSCGISYWKAPEMIPAGSNYAKEIPKAISNCSVFVFVVSESSQNSIWVEKEVDIAIADRKKIIPVKIDEALLNDMYRFYLSNVQIIETYVQADGTIPTAMKEKLRTVFLQNTDQSDGLLEGAKGSESRAGTKKIDTRSNAFRINKIPMQCEYCGERLPDGIRGVYKCVRCGREYYDDFRKIRNFLEQNGPAPAIVISKGTGVSMQTIDYYFNDESIETVPANSESAVKKQLKEAKDVWHYNGKNNMGNRRK